MSKIKVGQKFTGKIADTLNKEFSAKNAQGKPLRGWYKSAWPYSAPFLVNKKDKSLGEAVVWFPFVTEDPNSKGVNGWLNLVREDRDVITTRYVGEKPIHEINMQVTPFIGKLHIVFARWIGTSYSQEFFGVYTSERDGDTLIYRRVADMIETLDWLR